MKHDFVKEKGGAAMRQGMAKFTGARWMMVATVLLFVGGVSAQEADKKPAQEADQKKSSYMPVDIKEDFAEIMTRMKRAKPEVMQRQMDLLKARYDLSNRPAKGVTMSRGKPIQEGVRITLPKEMTWEKLATLSAEEIREKDIFPAGFLPLPHPNHAEGGMVFPQFHIDEIKKQEGRDLTRFEIGRAH